MISGRLAERLQLMLCLRANILAVVFRRLEKNVPLRILITEVFQREKQLWGNWRWWLTRACDMLHKRVI